MNSPLFEGIPQTHLDWASTRFTAIDLDAGVELIQEGESDEEMLIVEQGHLEIYTGDTSLGTAGPGDLVGEAALFGYPVRTASVRSATRCKVYLLGPDGYDELRRSRSPLAQRLEIRALDLATDRLRMVGHRISAASSGTSLPTAAGDGFLGRVRRMFGGGGLTPSDSIDVAFLLHQVPLFAGAPADVVDTIAKAMDGVVADPGAILCKQGEPGDALYLISRGLVDVVMESGDSVEVIAELPGGSAFGQMALVSDSPRMATCVAREETRMARLSRAAFQSLSRGDDLVASTLRVAVLRSISAQLAFANAELAMLDWKSPARSEEDIQHIMRASAGVEAPVS